MALAMNYRHIYHAGNFADIAKHVALLYCLEALKRKESAFFALDSHAGRGFYDLQAAEAVKSGEAERGIQRLIEKGVGDAALAGYFSAIHARRGKRLARYPGSPALIAGSLRPQDRALFVELMPAEAEPLVEKNYGDSFEATTLETVLSDLGVGRLVVVGAQTDACVRSTLHRAFVRGYDATLVSDAHTTEDQTAWGAPPPAAVIAHTNLYWSYQTAPGRTAGTVETKDVDFTARS